MNALYAVSRIPEWKDVSKKLHERFSVKPVYWICSSSFKKDIEDVYPDIMYHETTDANRGIFLEKIQQNNYLSRKTILEYAEIEREFYTMINRHDLDGSFSYEERKRLYYLQINYWLNVIDQLNVNLLVLSETPHSLSHFIIYKLCKKKGIRTIMLSYTNIPGTLYAKESFEDVPYIPIESKDTEKLSALMDENIEKLSITEGLPWYMRRQKQLFFRAGIVIRLKTLLLIIPYTLERLRLKPKKTFNKFYKKQGFLFEKSDYTRSEFAFKRLELRRRQYKLRKVFRENSVTPDLNKRYLYFPLHFQPERSSCPEGSVYTDQQVLIQMIADKLPSDTYIYIKEHPSQFMMTRGALGRPSFFYDDIKRIPGVILVDDSFSSHQLIDNSLAVITLTGTAGMEALLRGRPALLFGYAWYRNFPGAFYVEEPSETEIVLKKVLDGITVSVNEVKKTLDMQKKYLFTGYLAGWDSKTVEINYHDHVESLYQGYAALLKHLGYKENTV